MTLPLDLLPVRPLRRRWIVDVTYRLSVEAESEDRAQRLAQDRIEGEGGIPWRVKAHPQAVVEVGD